MSDNPESTGGQAVDENAAALETLQRRLSALDKNLADEVLAVQRSTRITGVIGVVCLLLVGGYFYYGYTEIAKLLKAESLVEMAGGILDKQMPNARVALEQQVKDNAADWAKQLSEQAIDGIPVLRKDLETYALDQFDTEMNRMAAIPEAEFESFLKNNHGYIEARIRELEKDPELSVASLAELEKMLDKELGYGLKQRSEDLFDTLMLMNAKLIALREGKHLDEEAMIERQVLMICKRLQIEQQDPELAEAMDAAQKPVITQADSETPVDDSEKDEDASAKSGSDEDSADEDGAASTSDADFEASAT